MAKPKGLFKPATPEQIASRPQEWEDQLIEVGYLKDIIESGNHRQFTDNEWIQLIRQYLAFEEIELKT